MIDDAEIARLRAVRDATFGTRHTVVGTGRAPCVHEGNVIEWCHKCNAEARHVRSCDLHERCTRIAVGPLVRSCDTCTDYTPPG